MAGFSIQCTTCRRSLRVTSPEAIGQILACPKCGSMVLIEAPAGWKATAAPPTDSGPMAATPPVSNLGGRPPIAPLAAQQPPVLSLESSTEQMLELLGKSGDIPRNPAAEVAPTSKPNQAKGPREPLRHESLASDSKASTGSSAARLSASRTSSNVLGAFGGTAETPSGKTSPWKDPPEVKEIAKAETQASAPAPESDGQTNIAAPQQPWPKWFWPGVAGSIVVAGLILAIRLMSTGSPEQTPPPTATEAGSQNVAENKAVDVKPAEPMPPEQATTEIAQDQVPQAKAIDSATIADSVKSPDTATEKKDLPAAEQPASDAQGKPDAAATNENVAANQPPPIPAITAPRRFQSHRQPLRTSSRKRPRIPRFPKRPLWTQARTPIRRLPRIPVVALWSGAGEFTSRPAASGGCRRAVKEKAIGIRSSRYAAG